jgi:hypothetical protein
LCRPITWWELVLSRRYVFSLIHHLLVSLAPMLDHLENVLKKYANEGPFFFGKSVSMVSGLCCVYIVQIKRLISCSWLYYVKTIKEFDTIPCVICFVCVRGLLIQPSYVSGWHDIYSIPWKSWHLLPKQLWLQRWSTAPCKVDWGDSPSPSQIVFFPPSTFKSCNCFLCNVSLLSSLYTFYCYFSLEHLFLVFLGYSSILNEWKV